ncbi:cobalt ECF transporter T component CbiQ [Aeromicrobium sp. CFBP 8757]|uniref:cobalt ECF transporter T component CbiQ n=1 Tax=Aeromicrobium sp. CFBP 8757 TaxID=2775288 RepID=UPI001785577D|nr:cobalt ECF transporter T component CbiQ [Aeromicrobium sp. CFBP 8757]MBD8607503.1 cobalt ECF transporter T component CbiQ [Aeromicrobium sp. CFBP 8757]
MRGLAIDDAAWSSRWRDHAVRDKACLSLGLLLAAALLPPWPTSAVVAVVALGLLVGRAGTSPALVARAVRGPLAFVAIGSVSVAVVVSTSGGPFLSVTPDSAARAAGVAGHAVAGCSAMLLLAMTTPMVDLLAGLRRLRLPAACVEVAGLVYRMLFVLLESVGTIRESQAARLGYSSPSRSLRSAGMLTAATLTRSWSRARRLEQGLAGRELTGSLQTLDEPVPGSTAFLAATVSALVAIVAVAALSAGVLP